MINDDLVQQMVEFTNKEITLTQAKKYLQWSRGDFEKALNYHYNAQERHKKQSINNQNQNNNAFSHLKQGAQHQHNLEKIIKNLKEEYNKPIEEQLNQTPQLMKFSTKNNVNSTLNFQETFDIPDIEPQPKIIKEEMKEASKQKQKQIKAEKKQIQSEESTELTQKKKEIQRPQINYKYEFPLLIGTTIISGHIVGSHNLKQIKLKPLDLQIEIQNTTVTNKKSKQVKQVTQSKNVVRIFWEKSEIGRLDKQFEDIISSLQEYIKVEAYHIQSPDLARTMDKIYLKLKVYLLKNVVSNVMDDTIDDDQQEFRQLRQEFQNLYDLLDITVIQNTLIDVHKKQIQAVVVDQKQDLQRPQNISKNNSIFNNDPFSKRPKQLQINQFKLQQQQIEVQTKIEDENKQEQIDEELQHLLNINKCNHQDLEFSDQPKGLETELYQYQQQALTWMLQREGIIKETNEKHYRQLHPLWKEYQTKEGVLFYFNSFTGQTAIDFPYSSQRCHGGILADEMGLGKTVMLIALIHSNPYDFNRVKDYQINCKSRSAINKKSITDFIPFKKKQWAKTLIVLPLTLLDQWESEIITHSKNKIQIYKYYGNDRFDYDLKQYDVVLTTYGTISHDFKKAEKSVNCVFSYSWYRIILDEAHYIKGRTIQQAQAVFELDGYYKWCLTGTPIQNKLDELFSLIHFIKLEPWSDYLWWNTHINKPHEEGKQEVFPLLQIILDPVLLRRTKQSKTKNGEPIINLPDKHLNLWKVEMSPSERELYVQVEKKSQDQVNEFVDKGILLAQYMKVFEILLRLRQICDHPFLMTSRSDVKNLDQLEEAIDRFLIKRKQQFIDQDDIIIEGIINNPPPTTEQDIQQYKTEILTRVKNNDIPICPVCLEQPEDTVVTICLHFLCRHCIYGVLANKSECPYCRQFLTKDDFMTVPRESQFSVDWKKQFKRSAKVNKLMEIITNLNDNDKCVIFSQFIGMLELIEFDLDQQGINYLRFDGKLNQQQRTSVVSKFKNQQEIKLLLVSIKAGGVGLNLTMANHVVLVDPWWNPAVEEQAIQRVHRIGQKKEVQVHRLIVENTVEERILEMHKHKQQLFDNTVAISEESKKQIRIEMFKNILFGNN